MKLDEETGHFSWIPTEEQGGDNYNVVLIAADETGEVKRRVSLDFTVVEVNTPPALIGQHSLDVNPKSGLKLLLNAVDFDLPPNQLTFSLGGTPPRGLSLDSETGVLSWDGNSTASLTGTHKVLVRVTDDGTLPKYTETEIRLHFTSIEIEEIPRQTIEEQRTLKLPILATILGQQPAKLSYRFKEPAPIGSQVDAQSGEFQWTAPTGSAGTVHNVTVEVAVATNSSLRGVVHFQIEVESLSPTAYWDLEDLPSPTVPRQELVLLKNPAFAQGV